MSKMKEQYVAVRAEATFLCEWMLIKTFKEECDRLGVIYNRQFTPFTIEQYQNWPFLFFSNGGGWSSGGTNTKKIYSSLTTITFPDSDRLYLIPSQWNEAIQAVKTLLNDISNHKNL